MHAPLSHSKRTEFDNIRLPCWFDSSYENLDTKQAVSFTSYFFSNSADSGGAGYHGRFRPRPTDWETMETYNDRRHNYSTERTHNCQALNYYEDLRKVVERKGNTSKPCRQ